MDIIVPIVNGVATIYQDIPPGIYQIDVLAIPGYEPVLYDEEMSTASFITLEPENTETTLYVEATGTATLIVKEQRADGTVQDLPDNLVNGIVIYRSNETGESYGRTISMTKNYELFDNLPYHYNEETKQSDGPVVSLAIDLNTLPEHYTIKETAVVSKQLVSQEAAQNEFVFLLNYTVKPTWQIFDTHAPFYSSFEEEGEPAGYLGIDGTLYLNKEN